MNIVKDYTFQDAATANGNGTAHQVGTESQIALFVTRTGGSGTVNFEGSDPNGTWYAIYATLQVDGSKALLTAGTGECWIIDATPWTSTRARISGIGGGAVITVKGHAISI